MEDEKMLQIKENCKIWSPLRYKLILFSLIVFTLRQISQQLYVSLPPGKSETTLGYWDGCEKYIVPSFFAAIVTGYYAQSIITRKGIAWKIGSPGTSYLPFVPSLSRRGDITDPAIYSIPHEDIFDARSVYLAARLACMLIEVKNAPLGLLMVTCCRVVRNCCRVVLHRVDLIEFGK